MSPEQDGEGLSVGAYRLNGRLCGVAFRIEAGSETVETVITVAEALRLVDAIESMLDVPRLVKIRRSKAEGKS